MVVRKRQTGKRATKTEDGGSSVVRKALVPDKIDLLGKEWRVLIKKENKAFGSCHHAKCEIHVNPNQSPENVRDTLLHEVIHALETEGQIKMNERQVRLLATLLLAALRQNKHLATFLFG